MDETHYPEEKSWRPRLGAEYIAAFFVLCRARNKRALIPLNPLDWLRKMIAHWWAHEFPGVPFPAQVQPFYDDLDA